MCKKIGKKGLLHQPHHKTMDIGEIVKHIILDLVKTSISLYHVYFGMSYIGHLDNMYIFVCHKNENEMFWNCIVVSVIYGL